MGLVHGGEEALSDGHFAGYHGLDLIVGESKP
jgi:hypothetical protein